MSWSVLLSDQEEQNEEEEKLQQRILARVALYTIKVQKWVC